jgi:ABC-type Zn2+ transport system substrate-binding protein/surface adhesin
MLTDENGNVIAHGHDHDHEHEHHDHDHEHHHHHGEHAETDALLGYMVSHNAHHAEELKEMAHTLRHEGRGEIADYIESAVVDFAAGNEKLSKALDLIKG